MNAPLAFQACYADWKLIKTRGVVQVVLEVPLHASDEAYRVVGGMPDAAKERWFAVAPLNQSATSTKEEGGVSDGTPRTSHAREGGASRSFNEMPPSQQAGMLCNDISFQRFLAKDAYVFDADSAARTVCNYCDIESRKELATNERAAILWRNLVADYRAWMREPEIVG